MRKNINYFRPVEQVFFICGISEPNENWHISLKLIYLSWRYFNVFVSFLGIAQSFLYVITVEKFDLIECCTPILNTGLYIGMAVRLIYFITHNEEAKELIRTINNGFVYEVTTPFDANKTMEFYDDLTYKIVRFWQLYLPVAAFFMIGSPIINTYRLGERNLPAKFYSPYEWWKSPYWELTLIQQVYMQTMLGLVYSNSDTFFVNVVFLTCGQFYLLSEKLQNIVYTSLINCGISETKVIEFSNIFNKYGNDDVKQINSDEEDKLISEIDVTIKTKEFEDYFQDELIECVEMHQFLASVNKQAQDYFSPCLFPIVMLTTFYLIFVAYNLLTDNNNMLFSLISQIFALLFQLVVFTYFGQKLTNQYEKLYDNLYISPWYLCTDKCKKMLLIVQINLLKPLTFSVGKMVVFNLPTLVNILRSFMSYLAVLRQLED